MFEYLFGRIYIKSCSNRSVLVHHLMTLSNNVIQIKCKSEIKDRIWDNRRLPQIKIERHMKTVKSCKYFFLLSENRHYCHQTMRSLKPIVIAHLLYRHSLTLSVFWLFPKLKFFIWCQS